jgi:GWxTD domain-containing protein
MNVGRLRWFLLAAAVPFIAACASTRGLRELDPKSRDFVSKVRYTITAEERKAFLALAPGAREAFIEDFWRRRDPTPATPENEYRADYYARIERANRLFSGGGSPGWLQDRGRVYITLGPPDTRVTYPRGVTFYGLPTEIWWYGLFTIVFIDEYWNDDYRIAPDSPAQIAMINQAQSAWNKPLQALSKPGEASSPSDIAGLDVQIEVGEGGTARFSLAIPHKNIWLKSSGKSLQANIEVTMRIFDGTGTETWTFSQTFPIDILEARLKEALTQDFKAQAVAPLKPGAYTLKVVVTNTTDGSKASLERKFEI